MKHPIPNAALDDRLGFIGTSGSGKTYNAGGAVERLLSRNARVVIVDPLGVWWGLRLLADGKKQSDFDVAIFGGPHGDLPLTDHAGALIGETAANMAESCIVDLSQLGTKASERRFMTDFLETIYRKAGGEPFHLIVDEADLFAPQNPPKGDEVLLNRMEQIVRRGRVKGFIPWLISQRPAVLNKNVLSQVDGLIAFKLTSTQDRDAIDSWIEGQADKAQGKAIKDSLPAMQVGNGIVWIPGRSVLETVAFPEKITFDSSRTPKRGEKLKRTAALKPLDLSALKDRLATVEAETKSNDPKALKVRIAELERQVRAVPKSASAPVIDKNAIAEAEARGRNKGSVEVYASCSQIVKKMSTGFARDLARVDAAAQEISKDLAGTRSSFATMLEEFEKLKPSGSPATAGKTVASPERARHTTAHALRPSQAASGDGTLSGPQLQLLRSLLWWKRMGHDAPLRPQVAAIAGWKITGGHLKNIIGSLNTRGLTVSSGGTVSLTDLGHAIAPEPDLGQTLHDGIRSVLSGPQRQIFETLLEAGGDMTREDIAVRCGWDPSAGHLKNVIGSLRTLEVITYPASGRVGLQDWVIR